jgi:hypothetical protein
MRKLLWLSFLSRREQFSQVRIYGKTRLDRIQGGIGMHLGGIHKQFLAPDQSCLLTLVDNGLKEALEHLDAIALTNTRETGTKSSTETVTSGAKDRSLVPIIRSASLPGMRAGTPFTLAYRNPFILGIRCVLDRSLRRQLAEVPHSRGGEIRQAVHSVPRHQNRIFHVRCLPDPGPPSKSLHP